MDHEHVHSHEGCEHTHEHTHDGVAHTHSHTHETVTHSHSHSHTHDHGDGHTHTHTHPHPHEHSHDHADGNKVLALLTYMLDHNIHHCAELKDLGASLSGEAAHQLYHAVEAFDQANGYLAGAIEELKK